ncbi:MAG: hypothetical protein KAT01_03190 [Candidatus Aminicenantes bacterium]|nr:hypothetical protein [Candidatus Aminicenantes bacterium]
MYAFLINGSSSLSRVWPDITTTCDKKSPKQNEKGRWILENTYNGRFQVNIERKGKPSKWITMNALRTIKQRNLLINLGKSMVNKG